MVAIAEAHAYAVEVFEQHGLRALGWRLRWNRMAGTAGITDFRTGVVTLSARAVEAWDWPLVEQLVLHEAAHALIGPGQSHGPVWELQVQALGGRPEEHCPRFSSPLTLFLGRAGEGTNPLFVLLFLVAALITAPPIGIAITLALGVSALVAGLRSARPVLPLAELAQIERQVLYP